MSSFGQDYNDKLSFLAEWYDYESAYQKHFLMNYYPCDNTIELYDNDLHRSFLKRTFYEDIQPKDIFIGNTIRVYGRQVKITDYADCRTKNLIGKSREHTFAVVKPRTVQKIGEIINHIQNAGIEVVKLRMCIVTQPESLELYDTLKGDPFLPFILDNVTSGPVIAMELVGNDAIERWKTTCGPEDPLEARKTAPHTLRALYGHDKASNALHASKSSEDALREAAIFFPEDKSLRKPPATSLQRINSTCCVIKPHAIKEGKLGSIISFITESKFKITAMQSFYLSSANADEFLEVYKGVVSDYNALLLTFLNGPCVALEISGQIDDIEDVHGEFRKFVGPSDSEIARQIRPNTLRGQFGVDKYRNAVHCTDLKEDTNLELEFFFKILS